MSKISVNLETALKQLNPNMILALRTERHRVKNWPDYLDSNWLNQSAKVESNIYNEGRIGVTAQRDAGRNTQHLMFNQTPLTEFIKKLYHKE